MPPTNLLCDPPKSWREDQSTRNKKVEWIELLFDLVFLCVSSSRASFTARTVAALGTLRRALCRRVRLRSRPVLFALPFLELLDRACR